MFPGINVSKMHSSDVAPTIVQAAARFGAKARKNRLEVRATAVTMPSVPGVESKMRVRRRRAPDYIPH
jgi:hypothetical protein